MKGFDMDEEYVLVEPAELDEIAPGRSQSLGITGFDDLEQVEPIYFDKTYYLGPRGKEYAKVYALLEKALAKANRAGAPPSSCAAASTSSHSRPTTPIEAKKAGESVEKAEPPAKATGAVDLMEALRASVEGARSPKDTREKATTAASPQRKKSAAKKHVSSKAESLQSLTKAELYKKAAAAHVPGRSTMSHDQLVDVLTGKASSR
ncbi:Ku protein [Streptomyces sp. LARHCF249]